MSEEVEVPGTDPRPDPEPGPPVEAALARLVERTGSRALLVVVDFDGTIAEIDPHPMGATILPLARRALRRLARLATEQPDRLSVAILSGRTAADVAGRVRVGGLLYLGNHGNEGGRLPRGWPAERLPVALLPELAPFAPRARQLGEAVAAAIAERDHDRPPPPPPAWLHVEDKGPAVAFHYRSAADHAAALAALDAAIARAAEAGLTEGFRRLDGRLVVEFQPTGTIDKGEAVARLIERYRPAGALVIGDDRADALAFAVIREGRRSGRLVDGLAVAVEGGREVPAEVRAAADIVLPRPRDAARLLDRLAARLEGSVGSGGPPGPATPRGPRPA
ncbi:MAG TPA: trehalose-phosphatase [Candidatus Binatia bacterium]|nr:trehalose-phosphatase [Candidatus Binatia bacterium]